MTYTRNSSWTERGQATGAQIQAWLESRASAGAAYVGLPQVPIPNRLGNIIVEEARVYGLNQDLLAAQIAHESAACQSRIARDKNNYSGYGAENDDPYGKAHTFATPREGIRVQIAHLMGYIAGDGPWNELSPRYALVKQAGNAGTVKTPGDLEQKWAWSPPDRYNATPVNQRYGSQIANLANDLLGFAGTQPKPEEPPVQHPPHNLPLRVSHIPRGNRNRPGHPMTPRYITIHETANTSRGANAEMHRRFTHNGGGSEGVSFHFVVDDSEIVELLPTTENGWHAGDGANGTGNRESIGIELCVNSDGDFQKTLALGARLVARLMETRNIPIERVVQHNHWSGKGCPANLRRGGWQQFIRAVRDLTEREPQQPEPEKPHPSARYFDVTGQYIAQGFRDYWEQFGDDRVSIEVFGYPLTGELPFTTPEGAHGSQQYFERAVFEWHPDKGRVLLRRLGAEALEEAA